MTQALITIDTELSAGKQARGFSLDANYDSSFAGRVGDEHFGVGWLMEQMSAYGIRGVFLIDPMPALVHGPEIVERMVHPILSAGHDVQVHIHTEWLQWAKDSPVEGRTGRNIGDFSLNDQVKLIKWARDALIHAGAPPPIAFRAGNFGANDDTLRALDRIGLRWDSSFNPVYAGRECRMSLSPELVEPVHVGRVIEVPVASIYDRPGRFRPAQICALSTTEMVQALHHATATGAHSFAVVTHSFEMLSRDRKRPNRTVMKRHKALCRAIGTHAHIRPATFADLPEPSRHRGNDSGKRLPASRIRTWARMGQQAYSHWRYEKRLRL
ncbi:MAG: hypothetical protein AB7E05_03790 [Sphingobium sp.]